MKRGAGKNRFELEGGFRERSIKISIPARYEMWIVFEA
jgi:hypothetical protein